MSRSRITTKGESAAVILPQDVLEQLGLKIGDEIDLYLIDRALVLRSLEEADRSRAIEDITKSVFNRRTSAYEQLAKGVE